MAKKVWVTAKVANQLGALLVHRVIQFKCLVLSI